MFLSSVWTNWTQLLCKTTISYTAKIYKASKQIIIQVALKVYLKLLRKTLQVVLVEIHDVFNKLLNWNGLHVICREETRPGLNSGSTGAVNRHATMHLLKLDTGQLFDSALQQQSSLPLTNKGTTARQVSCDLWGRLCQTFAIVHSNQSIPYREQSRVTTICEWVMSGKPDYCYNSLAQLSLYKILGAEILLGRPIREYVTHLFKRLNLVSK